ncbi:MAG: sulfide/dihydroorotate dehydrogenase-like FAD/NAD-binding protein, partial [Planctomycetota bacterium]
MNHDHADGAACDGTGANTHSVLDAPDARQNLVLAKTSPCETVSEFRVYCPQVALFCRPGQFVVVRGDERAERIPLTIADFDPGEGSITLVMQVVGVGTTRLDALGEGDRVLDIVGPLGHASEIENFGSVVMIGGGLGIAPVYPIQRAMKEAGNRVTSIIGARTKDLLFWEEKMRATSDDLLIATDDGSHGEKGFVTGLLKQLLDPGEKIDRVIAIGPGV